MEAVLSVQRIHKHYPGFALENVSFSLAPSRIMGLIGKNGAGKSTTLKAVLNMVSPESGSVTMFGKNFYQHETSCAWGAPRTQAKAGAHEVLRMWAVPGPRAEIPCRAVKDGTWHFCYAFA